MALSPQAHFSAAATALIMRAPYYATLFASLVRRQADTGTLAVSANGILYWNPAFAKTLTVAELSAVLEHEVLHVMLQHATRAKALGVIPDTHEVWNIAADCAINETLRTGGAPLPKCAVYPDTFQLAPKQPAEVYYRALLAQRKSAPKQDQGQGTGKGGKHAKGTCEGECGTGSGGAPTEAEKNDPQAAKGRTTAEIHAARVQTAAAINERVKAKGRGSVPADLVVWAEEQLKPPVIDWRTKLARMVRARAAAAKGATDLSWGSPSRRQAGLGHGPGRALLPAMIARQINLTLIIDTSGSMADVMTDAVSEAAGILQATGATVQFIAIDAAVQAVTKVTNIKQLQKSLKGGGGTNMAPAFAHVSAQRTRPDLVVCLTDGEIGSPGPQPAYPVLFGVVGSSSFTPPWGEVLRLENT